MHPSSPRLRLTRALLIILCLGALSCLLQAAPNQGESFTYRQPDGETLDRYIDLVRLTGELEATKWWLGTTSGQK